MKDFRHKKIQKKTIYFIHLPIFTTMLALGGSCYSEPYYNDQLTVDSEKGVKYQADFSILGRSNGSETAKGGRVLPPVKYSPPTSFTDSDTFFKSIGKQEEDPSPRRRR